MKKYVEVTRIEEPMLMELTNHRGDKCFMDVDADLGGSNKGFRPMELLAGSLAGCISVDVLAILKKQRKKLSHYKVIVDATRKNGEPAPFEQLHLIFEVDQHINPDQLMKTIQLVKDKYCSVSESMKKEIEITFEVKLVKI